MHRLGIRSAGALLAMLVLAVPAVAASGKPTIDRGGGEDYIFDTFIFELCGISTFTTVSERWSLKTFPDGSERLQVVRTFVPDDPRIPVEKGAGSSFTAADGTRVVTGKPLQLFDPDGGVLLLGAGLTIFGEQGVVVRGRNSLDVDLADHYCP